MKELIIHRLCGYPPFPSNNDIERMKCIATATFHFYPEEWSRISTEAKEFIKKLIVVDPMKRLTAEQVWWFDVEWRNRLYKIHGYQKKLPKWIYHGLFKVYQQFNRNVTPLTEWIWFVVALQVCMTNKPETKEVRTHLVKTLVETSIMDMNEW